jgi:hypothetical protein
LNHCIVRKWGDGDIEVFVGGDRGEDVEEVVARNIYLEYV